MRQYRDRAMYHGPRPYQYDITAVCPWKNAFLAETVRCQSPERTQRPMSSPAQVNTVIGAYQESETNEKISIRSSIVELMTISDYRSRWCNSFPKSSNCCHEKVRRTWLDSVEAIPEIIEFRGKFVAPALTPYQSQKWGACHAGSSACIFRRRPRPRRSVLCILGLAENRWDRNEEEPGCRLSRRYRKHPPAAVRPSPERKLASATRLCEKL